MQSADEFDVAVDPGLRAISVSISAFLLGFGLNICLTLPGMSPFASVSTDMP